MLNIHTRPLTLTLRGSTAERLEISRLLAAAVVSKDFETLLLNEPEAALRQGYQDESFLLTPEEYDLVTSVQASSLAEFAQILVRTLGSSEYLPCHSLEFSEQSLTN